MSKPWPFLRSLLGASLALALLSPCAAQAQLSKANQILINRGLQVQAMVATYDTFHLSTFSNANYTTVNFLWDPPRSYTVMSMLGAAPGFPWARWVVDETDMPPQGGESAYLGQLVNLQLADEWNLNDDATRTRAVNWFNAVRDNWPNTILSANNWGGQVAQEYLNDFISRAQPDMICFDTYPWKSVYDVNAPGHIGPPIGGPPTDWYSKLRIYRDTARGYNIPFGSYVQTFHAVEEYGNYNVYRNPSPSELRLNHSGALAFNSKMLIDFVYNNGSSSLFNPPGGDSNPNALYSEKADAARRARNLGKTLVRLRPIDEATAQWTTSVMFIRGRDSGGNLNPIPPNFYAGPSGTNPNTDWVADRNDPSLRGWVVTNTGTLNNGQPGDVILAWFKLLDESFDGSDHTNEIYFMVVNGLTATNGTAADCSQEIRLNFLNNFSAVELLDPETGVVNPQVLPLVSTRRQLVLNLNGGDAALFKIADGAPFVGAPVSGPPVIVAPPTSQTNYVGATATFMVAAEGTLPFTYQWRKNGANLANGGNIAGATSSALSLANLALADAGSYSVVVTGTASATSAPPAVLTVVTNPSNQLLFYEPFDYLNLGGPVTSNTPANWAYGGTGANDLLVVSGNLAYPGLAASAGNSVTNGGAGLAVRRFFGTNITGGKLWYSILFRINDLGYGAWSGTETPIAMLTPPDNTSFRHRVVVKLDTPTTYLIGVQKGGSGAVSTFSPTPHYAGETVLVVGEYDFTVTPNVVTLWIDPDPATLGAATAPASGFLTADTGTDGFTFDRFNLRQNTAASVPAAMQWDELRLGLSWASVTPSSPIVATVLANPIRLPGGAFRFTYTNPLSEPGTVYASSNLATWAPAGVATQSAPGVYQFTDPAAANTPRRFYRLLSP